MFLVSCGKIPQIQTGGKNQQEQTSGNKPPGKGIVVCTTTQIFDAVEFITGNKLPIKKILHPGDDPRTYELTPIDKGMLEEADLVLMNGFNLEVEMENKVDSMTRGMVVRLAEDDRIQTLGSINEPDPHCWFNPDNFQIYIDRILDALLLVKPSRADIFRDRAHAYKNKLAKAFEDMQKVVNRVPGPDRVVITNHDTFAYLAQTFGIEFLHVTTSDEPGLTTVERNLVMQTIRRSGSRALFIDTGDRAAMEKATKEMELALQKEGILTKRLTLGEPLSPISLGEKGSASDTYIKMMKHNLLMIIEALEK